MLAIVTGANSGMGRATVAALADKGYEMARRLKDKGITVNCCHPGAVATNMGVSRDTGFGKTITGLLKPFFQTPEDGARTAIFLATDSSVSDITGEYFYRCKIAKSSKLSNDTELSKQLFELSTKMCLLGEDIEEIAN